MGNHRSVTHLIASTPVPPPEREDRKVAGAGASAGTATMDPPTEVDASLNTASVSQESMVGETASTSVTMETGPWSNDPITAQAALDAKVDTSNPEHPLVADLTNVSKAGRLELMMKARVRRDKESGVFYLTDRFPGYRDLVMMKAGSVAQAPSASTGKTQLWHDTRGANIVKLKDPVRKQLIALGWIDYADDGRGWHWTDQYPQTEEQVMAS